MRPLPVTPASRQEDDAVDRALRDAQMRIEGRVLELPPGATHGALLELAGDILRCQGRFERLSAA